MLLSDLKEKQKAIIITVKGDDKFQKRIGEMGFIKGMEVEVVKMAPLKDPYEYKILEYEISLRKNEAALIEVEKKNDIDNITPLKPVKNLLKSIPTVNKNSINKSISKTFNIGLIGNPNSGKTTFFNQASGAREHVGNYCGVTVSINKSTYQKGDYIFHISDMPGIYSLSAITPDELFTVNYLLKSPPDMIINVVDASNIKRNLYLTMLLVEMGFQVVVALNMYDEVKKNGVRVDINRLSKQLKIPLIPTISTMSKSIDNVFEKIIDIINQQENSQHQTILDYGHIIENAIQKIMPLVPETIFENYQLSKRGLAIRLLEKNPLPEKIICSKLLNFDEIKAKTNVLIKKIEDYYKSQSDAVITRIRYNFLSAVLKHSYHPSTNKQKVISNRIDKVLTNKYLGLPVFFLIIYAIFFATFKFGEYPAKGIEYLFTQTSNFLTTTIPNGSLKDLVIDGIISGISSVLIFLPNILLLFFFISLMESSGYMARVVFIMDKIMRKIGLHGKSFIPLMMGFGCNVPAIMSSRILNNRSDRLITILVNPFMSCTARLPIYLLIIGTFFNAYAPLILFSIYSLGVLIAIVFARFFRKYLFPKKEAPFILELPPYRKPLFSNLIKDMWFKAEQYIRKIAGVILVASILIWTLSYYPRNSSSAKKYDAAIMETMNKYSKQIIKNPETKNEITTTMTQEINQLNNEKQLVKISNSYLAKIGKTIAPIMKPLDFDWKMTISILTGLAAKEVIVSTMAILYPQNSFMDIKKNENNKSRFQKIPAHIAFAFLIFILIYFPCVSVIVIVAKETSWKWAVFVAFYTTILAWVLSFSFVQIAKIFI